MDATAAGDRLAELRRRGKLSLSMRLFYDGGDGSGNADALREGVHGGDQAARRKLVVKTRTAQAKSRP